MNLKLLLILPALIFLGFVVWMNLTSGYFQYDGCHCGISYLTDAKVRDEINQPICAVVGMCAPAPWWEKSLLLFSRLDFNKNGLDTLPLGVTPPVRSDSSPNSKSQFCGGIAANLPQNQCPTGYYCQLEDNHPDAGGKCVSSSKQAKPAYTCPKTEWVDCMPGPGPAKPDCQKEYLSWAANNCPNFKGAAL